MGTILPPKPVPVVSGTPQPRANGNTSYTQMVNQIDPQSYGSNTQLAAN
jgi:hypothetical protein